MFLVFGPVSRHFSPRHNASLSPARIGHGIAARRNTTTLASSRASAMLTFVFWFVQRQPELREQFEKDCASQGLTNHLKSLSQLPLNDRKRFFELLN
jgi:hypothetical protein